MQSSKVKGFRKILTPFAPDQSGAVSLLYGLGGLIVIIDAGGCTGNVCGFDEPRWTDSKSAVFSAGLRDMDAILGRDEALVQKLENAAKIIDAKFIALVGTPVPAVIGTDYRALATMVKKRTGIDVIAVSSNGMDLYDKGIEKAELELVSYDDTRELLGFTPLDFMGITEDELMAEWKKSAKTDMLVVSSGAIKAAKKLAEKTGKTYEIGYPLAGRYLTDEQDFNNKKILIVHSQVAANSLRDLIRSKYPSADVTVASFFMMNREIKESGDVKLREENDFMELVNSGYDYIYADECLKALAKGFTGEWINMTHFAISGTRPEGT
ncbi:MAG: nitrogenase component 1 [Lachnospiraceae bacterium]|nr:nitrogenase component 1 [Lachnospiraceae bacterium]